MDSGPRPSLICAFIMLLYELVIMFHAINHSTELNCQRGHETIVENVRSAAKCGSFWRSVSASRNVLLGVKSLKFLSLRTEIFVLHVLKFIKVSQLLIFLFLKNSIWLWTAVGYFGCDDRKKRIWNKILFSPPVASSLRLLSGLSKPFRNIWNSENGMKTLWPWLSFFAFDLRSIQSIRIQWVSIYIDYNAGNLNEYGLLILVLVNYIIGLLVIYIMLVIQSRWWVKWWSVFM